MLERYHIEPDGGGGWTVYDVWTGQPVVIARRSQTGLALEHARELVAMLNDQARRGDRVVLQ